MKVNHTLLAVYLFTLAAVCFIRPTTVYGQSPQQTQTRSPVRLSVARFESVAFLDNQHGWIVSNGGINFATTKYAGTWRPQIRGTRTHTMPVHFASPQRGWCVGAKGTNLATVDKGMKWEAQTGGTTFLWESVHFWDTQHGKLLVTAGGKMFIADGGTSRVLRSQPAHVLLRSAHPNDQKHGWAVKRYTTIVVTTVDWINWQPQYAANHLSLRADQFAGATRRWKISRGGVIVELSSGGTTSWRQDSRTGTLRYDLDVMVQHQSWIVGEQTTVLATHNSGVHWTHQANPSSSLLLAVDFVDARHGWSVCTNGAILNANAGGVTWTQVHLSDFLHVRYNPPLPLPRPS